MLQFILASISVFLVIIILLVIILLIAKKYLSPSGNVNIEINGEKTLSVPQGASLMSTLTENGIFLPSACGGKSSCGQCKVQVLEGGGEILDSERPHFSRKQIKEHWRLGCQCKVKGDLKIKVPESVPEKHQRISDIVQRKYNLRILKFKKVSEIHKGKYGQKIFDLINDAYAELYGYSALSQRQIDYYVNMYIPVLRLENVTLIVDEHDDLVAVGIAMPSLSKALQKSRGRLFPFGFFPLLKALKGKNDVVDLLLVAVRPDYQSKGVNALLFSDLIPVFIRNGYKYAESNPELEENEKVQSQWQYFERHQHKRRRAYTKKL